MTDNSNTPLDREDSMADDASNQNATPAQAQAKPDSPPEHPRKTRRWGFIILGAVVLIAAIVYIVMKLLAPPSEETDDAYVGGNIVSITAREGGTVLALHADNTQAVKRGDPLIDLDPATADVALSSAEADLGRAVRMFRSNNSTVDEAQAEIASAQADLQRARNDYQRRAAAAKDGAVSGEEVAHARDAVTTASAALNVAEAKRAQAASVVQGTDVYDNPAVASAIAAVRRAAISRAYMHINSPIGGVIAQRTVQLGQRVAPGTPLMAVVPLDSLWVDANFRETQLQHLRVGQPAEIHADIYGKNVTYHGKVLGVGAGSGNAFALLPPQNASGNWIKIVQRLPVRIALDPKELRDNPLRVGLSVDVTVATSDRSGPTVAGAAPPAGGTDQSIDGGPQVDARIRQIVAENLGRGK
ncbi:HlyD family secretion protein [Sphingomonas oryzagri]|uniref:Efflux RND transporter periplasmic adaptor subunit n=1 Tax=Sphingomonas oryzagri TaxID=3042314 RepID=A0ABT6N6N4_9SPHN|nr:HlyD family efflux transporter periplasmic adaptor subunit [Sphingomonas oryzagri]MDH7640766.1 efflux RND transporter periplasmic adaptor subunit [Sphingomonas oryzagri]